MKFHLLPAPWIVLLLFFATITSCKDSQNNAPEIPANLPVAKVEIFEVKEQFIADQVEIMGSVQAEKKAIISSRISGHITEVLVIPGSYVEEGTPLILIKAEEISAQLLQARAQLDQAIRNLSREKKLLAKNAATAEAVKSLEDQRKIADAAYQEAVTMMSYTTIVAPFSGQVTKKDIDIGDLATPGKPLLHLEAGGQLQIHADVPESMVLNIHLGMTLKIDVPTAKLTTNARVNEIAPAADTSTRTVPIKLNIDANPSLRSGQFARVTLPGLQQKTILIPPDSLSTYGQMERVFLAIDGKARLRLIQSGKRYGEKIEIISGLTPGDRLIISKSASIQDNQPISVN